MGHVTGENEDEGGVSWSGCCITRPWLAQRMELRKSRRDPSSGPGEGRIFPAAAHMGRETLRYGTNNNNMAGTARRIDRPLKEGSAVVHQFRLG